MTKASPPAPRKSAAARMKTRTAPALGLLESLLGYHLRRAQVAVFQHFAATVGEADVTPGQLGVLAVIDVNPGLSQTKLGGALGIDRSTVVAIIDGLEERGLVIRDAAPHDRRTHALRLSDLGVTTMRRLETLVHGHEQQIAHRLSAAERATLIDMLQRIANFEAGPSR